MIGIHGVSKAYGEVVVVDDVELKIPVSGITSIIGPNGAGKSTLLSMISRVLPMDAGQITVDGLDVSTTRSDVLARRMATLRQENHFAVRLTVRDLVAFGRYPYTKGRPNGEDLGHIESALHYVGMTELSERFLDELSGGQRQRAFVAMVLCQDTDYVLLDEPLNNLDMKHAVAMMKQLRRAADELGKTIVLVVHDINFASCYSDHIVAMRDGRVHCQGSPEQLMQAEVMREIYDVDMRIEEIDGNLIGVYFT